MLVIECNTIANPLWITIPTATDSSEGLMSAADKAKLDGIPAGGGGSDGLLGAYQDASSAAQNIIGLTDTLGPVIVRDNATPTAAEMFVVQNSDASEFYLFAQGAGPGELAGATGTFDYRTTVTPYFILNNSSDATVGVPVQYSPFYSLLGTAWDTDDSVSRNVRFFWGVQPTSAATVSGNLVWYTKLGAAADTEVARLSSGGVLTLSSASIGTAQTIGLSDQNTTAATDGVRQFSPVLDLRGAGWNSTGGASATSGIAMQAQPAAQDGNHPYSDLLFYGINSAGSYERYARLGRIGTNPAAPGLRLYGDTDTYYVTLSSFAGVNIGSAANAVVVDGYAASTVSVAVSSAEQVRFTGTGVFRNMVAANETGAANAGAAALPANPRGFLTFVDSGGTSRKIPYYDV